MAHDFGAVRGGDEDGEARLPRGGVIADLGEELEGLRRQVLVLGWVPGDFDSIFDLHAVSVSPRLVYLNSRLRVGRYLPEHPFSTAGCRPV